MVELLERDFMIVDVELLLQAVEVLLTDLLGLAGRLAPIARLPAVLSTERTRKFH